MQQYLLRLRRLCGIPKRLYSPVPSQSLIIQLFFGPESYQVKSWFSLNSLLQEEKVVVVV